MRRLLGGAILLLLLIPTGSAQTLEEQLEAFHFERLIITVTWNEEQERAHVLVTGDDLVIQGTAASDLRECIDGQECRVPPLSAAASGSNRDGEVTSGEVQDFSDTVRIGIETMDQVKTFKQNMRGLMKIDNKNATSIAITDLRIEDAEGDTASTDPIHISVTATASYATVLPADEHQVSMRRTSANFTIAERIVVQGGKDWKIQEDSVQPDAMRQFLEKGKFEGSQEEFESPQPLTFTVRHDPSNSSAWVIFGSLAALIALGCGLGYLWWRSKA